MDNNGSISYTRNGQFQLDKNGYMVNSQGYKLSGYPVNASGVVVAATPAPLQIPAASLMPKATVNVTAGLNLNANGAVPVTSTFSPIDPTSYNNSTSTTVYDSLGNSHVATMFFQRQPLPVASFGTAGMTAASNTMTLAGGTTAGLVAGNTITVGGVTYTITGVTSATTLTVSPPAGATFAAVAPTATNAASSSWNTFLTLDGALVPAGTPPTPLSVLTFNPDGTLATPVAAVTSATFTPTGASAQTLAFNFSGTSQFGAAFGVNSMAQDGYTTGQLNGFSTSADGTIVGRYSNGQTKTLGQVVLSNFVNGQGLQPLGNNQWGETSASGVPLVGAPGSSSLGVLQSAAVEDSNVDLTAELVNMITAQRNYQANAQTIKTEDSLMQTLINLR
jgi:flagellar hook protein FlgE